MKKLLIDRASLVVGGSLLAIAIAWGWSMHERSALDTAAAERDASVQTYERLSSLKARWGGSPDVQRKRQYLLSHPSLVRQEQRQKSLYLEYANLSRNEFDRIVSTLMNAPFVILKLKLERTPDAGTISVEIEK